MPRRPWMRWRGQQPRSKSSEFSLRIQPIANILTLPLPTTAMPGTGSRNTWHSRIGRKTVGWKMRRSVAEPRRCARKPHLTSPSFGLSPQRRQNLETRWMLWQTYRNLKLPVYPPIGGAIALQVIAVPSQMRHRWQAPDSLGRFCSSECRADAVSGVCGQERPHFHVCHFGLCSQCLRESSPYAHVRIARQARTEVLRFAVLDPLQRHQVPDSPALHREKSKVVLHCVAEPLQCDCRPIVCFLAELCVDETAELTGRSIAASSNGDKQ